MSEEKTSEFEKELTSLINKYSKENDNDTPDFILAAYIKECLFAYTNAVRHRDKWFSFDPWGNVSLGCQCGAPECCNCDDPDKCEPEGE